MANLAVGGQPPVNGVAELHSQLVRQRSCSPSSPASGPSASTKRQPMAFTPRRWIAVANPPLSGLLDEAIGANWAAVIWANCSA